MKKIIFLLVLTVFLTGAPYQPALAAPADDPIAPLAYQLLLGKGMDVDWAKTKKGIAAYDRQMPLDFAASGVSCVRVRVRDDADEALLPHLERVVRDCLDAGLVPVVAYQADAYKLNPCKETLDGAVAWWTAVAERLKDVSHLLSFDLMIEATDQMNKDSAALNAYHEAVCTAIRASNPTRILFISPRLRSDAAYLAELQIPSAHNGYLMAEWHFYAAGPSKTNARKLWTAGTSAEKALIQEKIDLALAWQKKTGIPVWVGAWMPGDYNDDDAYTVQEQVVFAAYMTGALTKAGIPFAVNSDTHFYDREALCWIEDAKPVFHAIFGAR